MHDSALIYGVEMFITPAVEQTETAGRFKDMSRSYDDS